MDPFTGLGSTAVACARLGVSFIGAEIDETYLKEAVARVRAVTAGKMKKVELVGRAVRAGKAGKAG
jgi:site-specific DNA-methyltransferase (adenine-specific)